MWTHTAVVNGVTYLAAPAGALWMICLCTNAATSNNVQFVAPSKIEKLELRGYQVH